MSRTKVTNPRKVNIAPGVSMLGVLSALNYKPWYALAEFVDNAVQSMLDNFAALREIEGDDYLLIVSIDLDTSGDGRLTIRDNAAGIAVSDFPRAFKAAEVPPDRQGLSEFGMGMKSAACWFASTWSVRTTALGDPSVSTVAFDIDRIVNDEISELDIVEADCPAEAHFTVIELVGLHHVPQGQTLGKVKSHLSDIYRVFLRSARLRLVLNGEDLTFDEPKILVAPPAYIDVDAPAAEWRKEIKFDLGGGQSVHGFAALLETGRTRRAGFALFRRDRVIQGSGDEGYRPPLVFGGSNSYKMQRLVGELHLEGFEVTHTKDGFQWDDDEEPFLQLLRSHLDADPLPLLKQADSYRAKSASPQEINRAKNALASSATAAQTHLPRAIAAVSAEAPTDAPTDIVLTPTPNHQLIEFSIGTRNWKIQLALTNDHGNPKWLSHSYPENGNPVDVKLDLNLTHPFVLRFAVNDQSAMEVLIRLAIAMVVSELMASQAHVKQAATVLRNVDIVLTKGLADE